MFTLLDFRQEYQVFVMTTSTVFKRHNLPVSFFQSVEEGGGQGQKGSYILNVGVAVCLAFGNIAQVACRKHFKGTYSRLAVLLGHSETMCRLAFLFDAVTGALQDTMQ